MSSDTGHGWHHAANVGDIETDDAMQVKIDGVCLALFNIGGTYYATSDICTHAHAFLSQGYIQDDTVECPLHQGLFHIPTGRAMAPPVMEDLKTYPLKVEAGKIFVRLS